METYLFPTETLPIQVTLRKVIVATNHKRTHKFYDLNLKDVIEKLFGNKLVSGF